MNKYIAEALGTFTLSLSVALAVSLGNSPIPVPVLAGLVLGLFVYTIGSISGCHINPAVTLGALSIKKITKKEAFTYIIFQFLGAILAYVLIRYGFGKTLPINVRPSLGMVANRAFVAELLGTLIFTFGIASVLFNKVSTNLSGVVIGGSLTLGALVASFAGSSGILNPAVALTLNSFTPMYLLAPILGSIFGMKLYKLLMEK